MLPLARAAAALALAIPPALVPVVADAAPVVVTAAHLAGRTVLTNIDSGRAMAVQVGDDVEIRLSAYRQDGLTYTWEIPRSSASDVLHATAGRTTPNGDATAVLTAESEGTATVSAVRSCRPDPSVSCPLLIAPWKVTVEVR